LTTLSRLSAVDEGQDPLVGCILADRYRLTRVLGAGGMGVVYEGVHTRLGRRVAVKVLRRAVSSDPVIVARFRQEARSASLIGHENIISMLDFGQTDDGSAFLVMELLEGSDLADLLDQESVLSVERAIPIILQCCRALGAAHEKSITHRDMKPENIFLTTREGRRDFVKLVDFGIAKMSDLDHIDAAGRKITKTGMIFGTPEYMSPEQAFGRPTDHRVDLYSLGVIMFEMFAGRVPFTGDAFMQVLSQHMLDPPPGIRDVNPSAEVPPALEAVILRTLSKDPDDRQQTADEVSKEVLAALDASQMGFLPSDVLRDPSRIGRPEAFVPLTTRTSGAPNRGPTAPALAPTDPAAPSTAAARSRPQVRHVSAVPGSPRAPRLEDVLSGEPPALPTRRGHGMALGALGMLALLGVAGGGYMLWSAQQTDPGDPPLDVEGPTAAPDAGVAGPAPRDAGTTTPDGGTTEVTVRVESRPPGAEVRIAGRGIVCARTPCSFTAARERPIRLELSRGALVGLAELSPSEDPSLVRIVLRRPAPDVTSPTAPATPATERPDAGRPRGPGPSVDDLRQPPTPP